ncbi:MAG: DUF2294 domain-containing protein [Calditrichaceae bacterium]|jgi:uncharacterized protein YbcI
MIQKTKGQLEAEISIAIAKFEKEHLGRGPKQVNTYIVEDVILVRLMDVITPAEKTLAGMNNGVQLMKQARLSLIEGCRPVLEGIINDITGVNTISLHTDVSTRTGERIFVFCLEKNPEFAVES